jgi:2-polyprenyl-6-methoxyphenol hydroxylase-like FAD-dependent oxidoreductase
MGNVPYPYLIVLPQADTEAILIEHLHELGGAVERSQALEDIRQENHAVLASIASTVNNATTIEEIRARWVIGCDGAHSVVRKMLAIPFEGATYADEFLLAGVEMDWNKSRERAHGWLHHDGLFAVFPLPHSHQWRIIADVAPQNGQEVPQASLELFQQLLIARTGDTQTIISNPIWMSNFKINRRMVKAYPSLKNVQSRA